VFFHSAFLEHRTGRHIECPERLSVVIERLGASDAPDCVEIVRPEPACEEDVELVHDRAHVERVRRLAESGGGMSDPDTVVSEGSYEAAILAAGASIQAAESVLEGRFENAFALVRPPGHHATRSATKGFCIFNNAAIAAARTLADSRAQRVAILDFDIHHGNGTQETFYEDPRVFFVSFHLYPFFPGTGREDETGAGAGEGLTVNVPLGRATPPGEYLRLWREVLDGRVRPFGPDVVLVSAGFDTYENDPFGALNFRLEDFEELGASIRELADATCGGKVASFLEGGYDLDALADCVLSYLEGLGCP